MKTCLLIIDVQEYFIKKSSSKLSTAILNQIKSANYDLIAFTIFHNSPNSNFVQQLSWEECQLNEDIKQPDIFTPYLQHDNVFTRTAYSAFHNTQLAKYLKVHNIERLVICGMDTDACVLATAYNAFDEGFRVEIDYKRTQSTGHLEQEAKRIIQRNIYKQPAADEISLDFQDIANYMFAMVFQMREALYATNRLKALINEEKDLDGCYVCLRSILSTAGTMSKLMRPANASDYMLARGKAICEALNVTETDFPTIFDKSVRNGFEHYDERLDRFVKTKPMQIIDYSIGQTEFPDNPVFKPTLRLISHPGPLKARIDKDEIDIEALHTELADLQRRLLNWFHDSSQALRDNKLDYNISS